MMRPISCQALFAVALAVLALAWPAAGAAETVRYRIQPELTELTFKATSRLMDADGTFRRFAGEVTVDGAGRVRVPRTRGALTPRAPQRHVPVLVPQTT
jgi:polyisoprenoid-binding protein YceI